MSIIVSQVRVRNFRSLKEVTVQLSPNVTLLVGSNNAGKTTFLKALALALNTDRKFISQDDLFINRNGETLPDDDRVITVDVKIIPAEGRQTFSDQWAFDFKEDNKPDAQGVEILAFRTKIDFSNLTQEAQINRYVIRDWDSGQADENSPLKADLSGLPFHFIDAQRDLQEDLKLRTSHFGKLTGKIEYDPKQREDLEKSLAVLNEDAVNKSPVLAHLRTSLKDLNKAVQSKGTGVEITPFPKKVRDLHKGMRVHFQDGESDTFSLEYHGMGTRSWAALLAFKAKIAWDEQEKRNENQTFYPLLGLEEPEAHLHPNAQKQVYSQLSEINGQKIISTHSPYIVAQADISEIRHFQKESDETIINALNISSLDPDELRKIRREVLLSRGELLFSKVIVLFEGETESQIFPVFARKFWELEPFEKGICFISVDGNNYKPFLLVAKSMQIPWFIFSDYDKQNIKQGVDNALTLLGLDPNNPPSNLVTLGTSIEKYLMSEGYQEQLKAGITNWCLSTIKPGTDQRQIDAGTRRITNMSDVDLLTRIEGRDGKVRYPTHWANEIIKLDNVSCIPSKIRGLFSAIDGVLNLTTNPEVENAES
jgi:putative ATP-dependent endonuclease of OLD family